MQKQYIPFKRDEILERRKNSLVVQNSATEDLNRVQRETYDGIDYLLTDIKGSVGSYCAGMQSLKDFMRDERVYRVAAENCLNGLGTRIVPLRDPRRIKTILDNLKQEFDDLMPEADTK